MYANQTVHNRPTNSQQSNRLLEAIETVRTQAEMLIQESSHFKLSRDEIEHKCKA